MALGLEFAGFWAWVHSEGHGDLVSRLIVRIASATIWVIGVMNLLTKSP